MKFSTATIAQLAFSGLFLPLGANAECVQLIVNGDFETGSIAPWSSADSGCCRTGINDGTDDPSGPTTPKPPIAGSFDVFTEQGCPGKCVVKQELTLPFCNIQSATLSWKDRIFNTASAGFVDPDQEARVAVCLDDGNGPVDIWSTQPGDPLTQAGPNARSADVTALVQGLSTINAVFEEQDNRGIFNIFWDDITLEVCGSNDGAGCGDPHFKTWHGEWYDFHGICDMVLAHSQDFGAGLGLDIHLRTKPRYEYSFIEAAAIKIGDDVLEVASWGQYWFNGVEGADLTVVGGKFPVTYTMENKKRHNFVIKTGDENNGEEIVVSTFKDLVSVNVNNATIANFGSSVGLMGSFMDGSMVGRDGNVINDHTRFGQDWQVLESEPKLFQSPPPNNIANTCVPPTASSRRRLGERVPQEAAEQACAHHEDETTRDMCVFDVMAMADLEVAEAHGAY